MPPSPGPPVDDEGDREQKRDIPETDSEDGVDRQHQPAASFALSDEALVSLFWRGRASAAATAMSAAQTTDTYTSGIGMPAMLPSTSDTPTSGGMRSAIPTTTSAIDRSRALRGIRPISAEPVKRPRSRRSIRVSVRELAHRGNDLGVGEGLGHEQVGAALQRHLAVLALIPWP